MTVGIVCDSTADLPLAFYDEHDVSMVPLKVRFGEEVFEDWRELHPEDFYRRLAASPILSKTSQPSPAEFEAAYRALAERGCEAVVSVHLTSKLSGTIESATLASASSAIPVHIVDTKVVSQGAALVLKAAIAARDGGASAEEIAEEARRVTDKTRFFFVLETLEYLVKGGRAGKATGLAASLLNIKPILTFDDGIVAPFRKVKGYRKALGELARYVAEDAAGRKVRLGLLHSCAPERAEELHAALVEAGVQMVEEETCVVGAVIGTYAGPQAAGCSYYPLD